MPTSSDERDREVDDGAADRRQRHEQPREVDLRDQSVRVADEAVRRR